LLRTCLFPNCRLPRARMRVCPPSIFNPCRNCRSALFTTPASQGSFLPRPRTARRISQRRRRSPTSRPPRGRHLRSRRHRMPSSRNDPIQGSGTRDSAIIDTRQDAPRHPRCWRRGSHLAGSGPDSGRLQRRWQATQCPSAVCLSFGASLPQSGCAIGHRV